MTRILLFILTATLASSLPLHAQENMDPPKQYTNSLGMKFVWIPPGNFMMGSPRAEKGRLYDNETQHQVTLTRGFYMGVYTVTQEQWQAVMGSNPSKFRGDKNLPVEMVSWNDCREFLEKLHEKDKDKKAYRLPTEAQWEYACRAGTTTPFHFGETMSTEQANFDGNKIYGHGEKGVFRLKTTPVGTFPANAWGLHDMHGNVWQWCQDWYGDYPKKEAVDPHGPETGDFRVLRGGSWGHAPGGCRSAFRFRDVPRHRFAGCGLRVCFSLDKDDLASKKAEPPPEASPVSTQSTPSREPPKHCTNSLGMKFVWIPPGSFTMGSPTKEKGRNKDETEHKVTLTKGFYMGVYTVTQEQWQEVMGNNPSSARDEKNLPVANVSWNDCQEFIKKLRERDKKPYRLPTEAEWEYCCRAGTTTPFHFGDTISTQQANYNGQVVYDNGKKAFYSELLGEVELFFGMDANGKGKKGIYRERPTPVDNFSPNPWGLHDMHGNLWQWCQDFFGDYPKDDVTDPQGPKQGRDHVLRGGSWSNFPENCRSATRAGNRPGFHNDYCGLRVCFCLDE